MAGMLQNTAATKEAGTAQTDEFDNERNTHFEERRHKVIEKVQEYVQITFHELHAASRQDTRNLLEGTKYITEKDIDGWESYVNGLMQDQITSARKLYEQLMDPLLEAMHEKAISERVVSKLYSEFRSEEIGYKQKEWYVQTVLPERLREWKRVKKERDEIVKHPNIKTLKSANISHFDALLDADKFADLEWKERKKLIEEVRAHLAARKNGTEKLMPSIRSELDAYRREGILHPSKVSTWMKRIFTTNATSKDIEAFLESTVRPFAESWRSARKDFDMLHKTMGKNVPRGFKPLTIDAFLLKDYKQRTSYCDLLRLRLENVAEQDKQLASIKLRIRHNLDTEDWEGAEQDLGTALKEWPDNRELRSMQIYLKYHRTPEEEPEKKETPNPTALLMNLRSMLKHAPGNLRTLYAQAMQDGPTVLHRLQQIVANAGWAAEHGYTSEDEKLRNMEDRLNKEKTAYYAKHGHSKTIEHNVLNGETAMSESINDDCQKAQYIYMSSLGKSALMEKVRINKDNELFGYWTILCDMDVSLDKQIAFSKNMHHPMKTALRQLDSMGYLFTVAGSLRRKGTASNIERN